MRIAVIAAALSLMALPAQAASWLAGDWKGVFECGETKIPLSMEFFADNRGDYFGGFRFRLKEDVMISLRLHGTFSATGELKFEPRQWIFTPRGDHQMFGFTAQAHNRAAEGKPDQLVGE
eukprot:gene30798-31357_t